VQGALLSALLGIAALQAIRNPNDGLTYFSTVFGYNFH
jgi:hypothetical protein